MMLRTDPIPLRALPLQEEEMSERLHVPKRKQVQQIKEAGTEITLASAPLQGELSEGLRGMERMLLKSRSAIRSVELSPLWELAAGKEIDSIEEKQKPPHCGGFQEQAFIFLIQYRQFCKLQAVGPFFQGGELLVDHVVRQCMG